MKIDILTLFPKMFKGPFEESIIKRAIDKGIVKIKIHNLRNWAKDKHKTVDNRPFGGGTGMILMIQPIHDAVESLKLKIKNKKQKTQTKNESSPSTQGSGGFQLGSASFLPASSPRTETGGIRRRENKKIKEKIILLSPRGKVFNQQIAKRLSKMGHLILICGHYEGVDERVRKLVDEEISIGDYVLTGGELPAMVLVDTIVRLIPGVLEKSEAIKFESFSKLKTFGLSSGRKLENLLEYPQYTRPANYKGWKVPKILLSGNHEEIEKWRLEQASKITKKRRPDLIFTPEVEASFQNEKQKIKY